jgi:hypothetical protein
MFVTAKLRPRQLREGNVSIFGLSDAYKSSIGAGKGEVFTYTLGPSKKVNVCRYAEIAAAFSGKSESQRSGTKSCASSPQKVRL